MLVYVKLMHFLIISYDKKELSVIINYLNFNLYNWLTILIRFLSCLIISRR